jgi:hypothetical protein|tara:strand:- start:376 stop:609 length:234 start_codon:yes stop_codon:yes gene_type:complete
MLSEFTKNRYRALQLLAEHIRTPSRELSLNAIISDISDEDLRWVTDKIHYYLLRLLDDVEYDSDEEESIQLLENSLR